MHKILFENKLSTYTPFSPFGSSKNFMPGIITKIKNKIQDLFQPSINPSSTIQRIQCYSELNQDKELSYQFQNNLVIVDHITPNQEQIPTSKRKTLYPFDLYLQELAQNENQISNKPIINKSIQSKHQEPFFTKTKKQMKFKKNHVKIEKSRKMEVNTLKQDYEFNSQNLNVEINNENSTDFLSNHSIKKIKCIDNTIQIPNQQQYKETKEQMSQINQFEIQSFQNIKQNQQISCQQLSNQNNRHSETQNTHSCNIVHFKQFIQENQYFSSSTGTNSKRQTQETLFNKEHNSFSQETDSSISEQKSSIDDSLQIQNNLYSIFHPDITNNKHSYSNQQQQSNNNQQDNQQQDKNQISQDIKESPKQINRQKKLIFDSEIINLSINLQNKNESKNQIEQVQSEHQIIQEQSKCQNSIHTQNIILTNPLQNLENNQKDQNQQSLEQNQQKELFQKQLDDKLDSPQSQNTLLSMNCESTTSNIIQEYDKPKEFNMKNNQQNNPFLDTTSHISSDQVSQYFLQGVLTENTQNTQQQQLQITKDQNPMDIFKVNNQLFNFNHLLENQGYQNQSLNPYTQQQIPQRNSQCLVYKQMEIIDQAPQFNPVQYNNYQQPIQNYYPPSQLNAFQQSQSCIPWFGYQQPICQENPYPQMQQSSFQISSINLFQSNSSMVNSNPNCCQEESIINHVYTKQDVLSFFQDTNKKQDQNLFSLDSIQNNNTQAQNLNSSFNRGQRKKQRINYN